MNASSVLLLLVAVGARGAGQGSPPEPSAMQEMRALRWQESEDQQLVLPFFEATTTRYPSLLLLNRFAEPLVVEIEVLGLGGESLNLGSYTVPARDFVRVDLHHEVEPFPSFQRGALRILYFGDTGMLQGWVLYRGEGEVMEQVLLNPDEYAASDLVSYWDAVAGSEIPVYAFHNIASHPVAVSLQTRLSGGAWRHETRVIAASGTLLFRPVEHAGAPTTGVMHIRIRGPLPSVLISATAHGPAGSTVMPIVPTTILADARVFESMPISRGATERENLVNPMAGETSISLADTRIGGMPQRVYVEVLSARSGQTEATLEMQIAAGSVRVLDLEELLAEAGPIGEWRLRVESAEGALLVRVVARQRGQTGLLEVPVFDVNEGHSSGQYPMLAIREYNSTAVFVNLGILPVTILGHISSRGEDFALVPFEVPAKATRALNFDSILETQPEDILGRSFPADFERAFFQWTARGARRTVLARMVVSKRGDAESFGFNCFGCCEEFPVGGTLPDDVAFDLGEAPGFQTAEWIATCAGTMGPYYISPNSLSYSSPISWDSHTVASSAYTNQDVSFQASGSYMWIDCSVRTRTVFGGGNVTVDRCQRQNNPDHDPAKSCFQQAASCSSCYSCCEKQKQVGYCRCRSNQVCRNLSQASCGTCKQACFGHFNVACSTQETSCNP